MLTKGSIETFKNVLRTFIKSILDFIKKLRSGWRLRGEARSIWRQAHTPDPMHWDLNEAKLVQYYYFREAYKWEYKQGQVQVRVTARERKESMAIDPSLENGYHWDDEERIADQQKGRARKNAAKYAVLYEELINAKNDDWAYFLHCRRRHRRLRRGRKNRQSLSLSILSGTTRQKFGVISTRSRH